MVGKSEKRIGGKKETGARKEKRKKKQQKRNEKATEDAKTRMIFFDVR